MHKPLIGIAVPAVIIAGSFALLQNGGSNPVSHGAPETRDGRTEHCVEIPANTPVVDIVAGGERVTVPSKGDPSLCVTWDSKAEGTPTITYFKNCGEVCAAVRVADLNVRQDLAMSVRFRDGDKEHSFALDPDPVNITQAGQETCIAIYAPDKPSPCDVLITSPSDLTADASRREVNLEWAPSREANDRDVEIQYEIWRGTDDGSESFVNVGTTSAPAFRDSGLERKTTYWYYVVAVADSGHRSGGSEIVSVTTK